MSEYCSFDGLLLSEKTGKSDSKNGTGRIHMAGTGDENTAHSQGVRIHLGALSVRMPSYILRQLPARTVRRTPI